MKKNVFLILFCAFIIVGGLLLQSCSSGGSGVPGTVEENSVGIIKLTNNSKIGIGYVSIEKGGNPVKEYRSTISPEGSYSFADIPTGFYTVFLEDSDGDGWTTKSFVTVRKNSTAEVKFAGDFKVSN